jgi:hypothetical protein
VFGIETPLKKKNNDHKQRGENTGRRDQGELGRLPSGRKEGAPPLVKGDKKIFKMY